MISLLHTPDGVRDIYGLEFENKQQIKTLLLECIHRYGYQDIQTPTFEFFDIFSKDIGTTPSKDLYKFFDKEGNTLVLRPDFTPSVARCAAKYFMEEDMPLRFCYEGNAYSNTSELQGKLKETTQTGVELIGDNSIEADAESIMLMIEGLKRCGLKEFQISIGEISYFKGICEEAGLKEEEELCLRDFMSSKNYFGAQEYLRTIHADEGMIETFEGISKMFVSRNQLTEIKEQVQNSRSKEAVCRLIQIDEILANFGYDSFVTYDLSMLSKYNYYTGILFRAYTYGVGEAIAKGGRYDGLLSKFNKNAPSVGCVFLVDELLNALKRQNISFIHSIQENVLLLYNAGSYIEAMKKAQKMRSMGRNVTVLCKDSTKTKEDLDRYCKEFQIYEVINACDEEER